jgi:hypothetical protein
MNEPPPAQSCPRQLLPANRGEICGLVPLPLPVLAQQIFYRDNFDDGPVDGLDTWTCEGTGQDSVGPGFTLTEEGAPWAWEGPRGLRIVDPIAVPYYTQIAEAEVLPASGEGIYFSCFVKPFVSGDPLMNSFMIFLDQVSSRIGPDYQVACLGVTFASDGRIVPRSPGAPTAGNYIRNQWCHVEIEANTLAHTFRLDITGDGVVSPVHVADLPFNVPIDEIRYIQFSDNCTSSPTEHAIDSMLLCRPPRHADKGNHLGSCEVALLGAIREDSPPEPASISRSLGSSHGRFRWDLLSSRPIPFSDRPPRTRTSIQPSAFPSFLKTLSTLPNSKLR